MTQLRVVLGPRGLGKDGNSCLGRAWKTSWKGWHLVWIRGTTVRKEGVHATKWREVNILAGSEVSSEHERKVNKNESFPGLGWAWHLASPRATPVCL